MNSILVIEDHLTMREGMIEILRKEKYEVYGAKNATEGLKLFSKHSPDLTITDLKMEDQSGLDVLQSIKETTPESLVMVITAFGTIDLAVEAMKLGAIDFVTKPFSSDLFKLKVKQAISLIQVRGENRYLKEQISGGPKNMIGESDKIKKIIEDIDQISKSDAAVFISGESGTGKELIAREIHHKSLRAKHPFIKLDCSALSIGILESELFGHEKGSFTGAVQRRIGRFELAHQGTLFLDEIGDLSPQVQLKLLRVLQEKTFERVGGSVPIQTDVRLICATHKNLNDEIKAGRFREDLYYRIHVVPVCVPPLRERNGDTTRLVNYFLGRWNEKMGTTKRISAKVIDVFKDYSWPGNVRELENVLERMCVLSKEEELTLKDVPPQLLEDLKQRPDKKGQTLDERVQEYEKNVILQALNDAHGVKNKAAEKLGIKTSALYYKMDKHGL